MPEMASCPLKISACFAGLVTPQSCHGGEAACAGTAFPVPTVGRLEPQSQAMGCKWRRCPPPTWASSLPAGWTVDDPPGPSWKSVGDKGDPLFLGASPPPEGYRGGETTMSCEELAQQGSELIIWQIDF